MEQQHMIAIRLVPSLFQHVFPIRHVESFLLERSAWITQDHSAFLFDHDEINQKKQ